MAYKWFVTPVRNPDRILGGPYDTRAEAEIDCLIQASEANKWITAFALKTTVTQYYIPALRQSKTQPIILPNQEQAPLDVKKPPTLGEKLRGRLTLQSNGDLAKIALALGVMNPPKHKETCIDMILKTLEV